MRTGGSEKHGGLRLSAAAWHWPCALVVEQLSEHSDFNAALDLHCREASRIIKEFSGGWYGKTLFQEGDISPDKASQFAHVAFKKLRAELRKRRGADA